MSILQAFKPRSALENKNRQGITALIVVLVIGASALIMSYGAALLGLGELDMGFISSRGTAAFYLADGCVEESLRRLQINNDYEVSGFDLELDLGSCLIDVASSSGEKIITVKAGTDNYYKTIEAHAVIVGGEISINSWEIKEN